VQSPDQDTGGRRRTAGGISLQTLLIASVASAVTSYVVSRVWGAGTLIGAAATPVIVALVAESLRKPVETVSATAKRVPVVQYVPVVRSRAPAAGALPVAGDEPPTRVAGEPRPRPGADADPPVDPGYTATLEADRDRPAATRPRPRWGLVLATAAAAFAIVVAVYTIPDLVAGKSITGSGRSTTLFGGQESRSRPATQDDGSTTKTVTTTTPATVTTTAPQTTTTVPAPTTTATTPTTAPEATPTETTPPATTTTPTTTTPASPVLPDGTTTPVVP
jgi:hypothetical protein